MTRFPNAPRDGEVLISRAYAVEDSDLEVPPTTTVTGTGYITGFAFEANAGEVLAIYDQRSGGKLVFVAIFGVANPAYTALPQHEWIPFKDGARIVVGAGGTARIRFRQCPIDDQPENP